MSWNSTLKRKKPIQRGAWKQKPRKPWKKTEIPKQKAPMRQVSKKRQSRLGEYRKVSKAFLERNQVCKICLVRGIIPPNKSTEIHHHRGRIGRLLCDVRGFVASCFPCRDFPHANTVVARELGVLAPATLWNVPFPD